MTYNLIEEENKHMTTSHGLGKHRPGLYPSEASVEYQLDGRRVVEGKCLRAAWYRSMGCYKALPTKPSLSMAGNLGKSGEEMTVDKWKAMGILVGNNIKFYNRELAISGELDAVIRDPNMDNHLIGIEIKSYYGYYANKVVRGGKRPPVPGVPKIDQFLQSVVYSWDYKEQLDEYWMYYLERGDGKRVTFKVGTEQQPDGTNTCWWEQLPCKDWSFFQEGKVYQPFSIEDIHSRYKRLITLLKGKVLPPKDFELKWDKDIVEWNMDNGRLGKTKYNDWKKNSSKNPLGDWQCSYCKFKDQCAKDSC